MRSGRNVTLGVGLMSSGKHMGTAELQCSGGCSCEPLLMDTNQEIAGQKPIWFFQEGKCFIVFFTVNMFELFVACL